AGVLLTPSGGICGVLPNGTTAGILYGFHGSLTQNPAMLVEIDDVFDFSDTPKGGTNCCC
ncbi:MAG: hypothetical protein PUI75_06135, partial [Subdoligranulum sp.]|nr:hypothetical protein [Subdoligranulum sp.]MDY6125853.1 hypothetical protein [Gemmiger qucibialis]